MMERRSKGRRKRRRRRYRHDSRVGAELNGCWARSAYFEERCNCSRKIFFVLDYAFARHRGGPDRRARVLSENRVWLPSLWDRVSGTREGKHLRK